MSEEIKTNWWKCDNCGKTHIGIEKAHECELSHTIDKQRVLDALKGLKQWFESDAEWFGKVLQRILYKIDCISEEIGLEVEK